MNSDALSTKLARIIQLSLSEQGTAEVDLETYQELKDQAVFLLPAAVLDKLIMPDSLRHIWKNEIRQQICYNTNISYEQVRLPVEVPYVILKGTAAAQYYPHPEYRVLGDIDVFPRHEDFELACEMLLQAGYTEQIHRSSESAIRHRVFTKNMVTVEVHAYYSIMNDPNCAEFLDELIIRGINESHVLSDDLNGLVLLEHINQHMEEGLGLRQIIDWMMYVDRYLTDEKWERFKTLSDQAGLTKLAVTTTRLCEMYFGLSRRSWCTDADEKICHQLWNYVFSCGNFGSKREYDEFNTEKYLSRMRTPKSIFLLLQQHGRFNWRLSDKYAILRPFAWIYQIYRYIKKTIARKVSTKQIKSEYKRAKERNALLDALEVTQNYKGLVVYKDGKYLKE